MDGIAVPQVELPQQPGAEKPDSPKAKSRVGLIIAVALAIVAIAAFAYAVVWSGGLDQIEKLLAPYLGAVASQPAASTKAPAATAPSGQAPSNSAQLAAVALPAWAQSTMYQEQLTSQPGITAMVNDDVKAFVFSTPVDAENGVQVPLKATYRAGNTHTGTISLIEIDGAWFFAGLDTGVSKEVPETTAIDSSIVDIITKLQATPTSQEALKAFADGTITGMDVESVVPGDKTTSLNVLLHGGAYEGKRGRFVCVEKDDGIDTYWFVTGFSWQ